MGNNNLTISAFAPASVANVAVGFDILGFSFDSVGDIVTLTKVDNTTNIEIESITGLDNLPFDPNKNTATIGLVKLISDLNLPFGFKVRIKKGIPLSSGMGGSAASSVAAIFAANAFLSKPLSMNELLFYALEGEKKSSGAIHADNIAPSLLGGLTLIRSTSPLEIIQIPPPNIFCVLVHPDLMVETKYARSVLKNEINMSQFVQQSSHLAAFIAACFNQDNELIRRSCKDFVIENQRSHLIAGFQDVQKAAINAGALACSISGSGPSVFAFAEDAKSADKIKMQMVQAFKSNGILKIESWIAPISNSGAKLI